MSKRVEYHEKDSDLAAVFNDLGARLQKQGLALGAIFVGHRKDDNSVEFGLLMREDLPQNKRWEILCDLETALGAAKDAFKC